MLHDDARRIYYGCYWTEWELEIFVHYLMQYQIKID